MSRIDDVFAELRRSGRKAFMPFLTCGDPDMRTTVALASELAARGASLCELGVPYSDPIADGPVIQASYTRALERRLKLNDIFAGYSAAQDRLAAPSAIMVSYAIILRRGLQKFVDDARAAGFSGAIVPDLPVEESAPLAEICRAADFNLIQLVTPTTPRERMVRIAGQSTGFLYFVSVAGITGERRELPPELIDSVAWLRTQTDLPICIGFGISTPEHVRTLAPVCDGVIVGSAFVRRIAGHAAGDEQALLADVGDYAQGLIDALHA